jgi:hypothetical protein
MDFGNAMASMAPSKEKWAATPSPKGLLGHSDADALLHAITESARSSS